MPGPNRLRRIRVRRDADAVSVDLADVRWIDPLHLVYVAALADGAHRAGRRFRVRGLGAEQAGYAARMHLGDVLDDIGVTHSLERIGREHDRSDTLHELATVRGEHDVRTAAALVGERVWPADPDAAAALHVGVAEIGANACDHSQVGHGFVAVQTLPARSSLRVAVADSGVGLLATLSERGARDDADAIALALAGVSESDGLGHGMGVRRTVEALVGVNGQALLLSGRATVRVGVDGRRPERAPDTFTGTLFEGRIPLAAGRHAG